MHLTALCYASHIATSCQNGRCNAEVTKRLHAVTGMSRPTDLSQKCERHKEHKARFILRDTCALCGLGEFTGADSKRGSAQYNTQLNRTQETVYVRQHTYKNERSDWNFEGLDRTGFARKAVFSVVSVPLWSNNTLNSGMHPFRP